ncbi:MAG: peptidylprolyl isomerase [Nevskiaceae bacterium]|jgi:peptidyl-prolyl cis-trans isomerase D|nr:peptidylprolyl isomerase [Nevskiaceae bacterium]
MLQNIGDTLKGQRWLAYLLLGALALVFAAWGAYGIVDVGFGISTYAAKVNGQKISATEINDAWQRQLPQLMEASGGNLSELQREVFQQQLLDGEIRSLASEQQARKQGYAVSNAALAEAFQSEPAFQIDGVFNSAVARELLARVGISEEAYLADLRRSQLTNQLLSVIGASEFLTPVEMRRLLGLQDEQREVRFLMLPADQFSAGPAFDAAAVEAYYKANEAQYTLPEAVRLNYAELSLADLLQDVTVTDEAVRARYDALKDNFIEPETRRASHILITVDATTDDAQAKTLADDISKRLQAGEDFAALAKQYSKDSGSADLGGDLGWAPRDTYVEPFADALFALTEGQISPPVKTEFGYHIIRLDGIRAGESRSFEEVKPELTVQVRDELAADEFGHRQEELQSRIESGGSNLAQLAQQFGLRTGEIERFERGAGGLPLGSDAELNREVFSDTVLNQRRVAGPIPQGEDRLIIVQVQDHMPPALKPLEEVREEVVESLTHERGAAAALAAAEEGLAKLVGGESLDKIATGLKMKTPPAAAEFVSRMGVELPVELRDAAFALPRPQEGMPQRQVVKMEDGSAAVLEVLSARMDTIGDPQFQALRTQREQQVYGLRSIEAYLAGVVNNAKISKNPDAFTQ